MSFMKNVMQMVEEKAQAILDTPIECLEWFVEDDVSQLYAMIEENMGIDEWIKEMGHRIFEANDKFYILEEEDLLQVIDVLYKNKEEKGE
jgi:hypothetical protein